MQWKKSCCCARAVISGSAGSQHPDLGVPRCPQVWRCCCPSAAWLQHHSCQLPSVSHSSDNKCHQTLLPLTKIFWQTARIQCVTFLLFAGEVTQQPDLELERPRNKHLMPRNLTQHWQKHLTLKWHKLCSSKSHSFTSAFPKAAIPGKAQLTLLAAHTPQSWEEVWGKALYRSALGVCFICLALMPSGWLLAVVDGGFYFPDWLCPSWEKLLQL